MFSLQASDSLFYSSVAVKLNTSSVGLVADDEFSDVTSGKDNRELLDSRENQNLSRDEIHNLRLQGFSGEASR